MQAVIFDLDGTLIDTLEDLAAAMNHALGRAGLPPRPVDDYRQLVGWGAPVLVERALPPGADDALRAAVLADFRDYYGAHALDRTAPYPGVPALLAALRARRLPLAVLSNKPDDFTRSIVASLFGPAAFAVVRGARDGAPRKPDPAAAMTVARLLAVPAPRCLFVGDSEVDVRTARAARMVPIGVTWGFRDPAVLRAAGARTLIRHPRDLLRVLDGG